ncbi:MAG: MFS transporter [Actinobacteria bacterium]|nr:MFS transporter [Actinomycetota bacterium]
MTSAVPRRSEVSDSPNPHWIGFSLVTLAYLAVTVCESILAPLFPVVADELDLDLAIAGFAFGLLTGAIAVGNFAGGYVLARLGPRTGILASLALAAAGCALAGTANARTTFLAAQALIGLGAGIFFAPGLNAVGRLAGAQRRGLAMGIFGVAFSGGLTIAALLAAAGDAGNWRVAFWVATATCAVAALVIAVTPLPARLHGPPEGRRRRLREALGVAVIVGGVGAVLQYGTVAFLPVFAVASWRLSPAAAALLLAAARIVSVPAKLAAGAAADRWGSHRAVWGLSIVLVLTGAWWTTIGDATTSGWAAVVFAATVSALFPIANLLAVEGFGERGPLLGTYRSVQIGIGAAGAYLIGVFADAVGLAPTLAVSVLLPVGLFALRRPTLETTEVVPP